MLARAGAIPLTSRATPAPQRLQTPAIAAAVTCAAKAAPRTGATVRRMLAAAGTRRWAAARSGKQRPPAAASVWSAAAVRTGGVVASGAAAKAAAAGTAAAAATSPGGRPSTSPGPHSPAGARERPSPRQQPCFLEEHWASLCPPFCRLPCGATPRNSWLLRAWTCSQHEEAGTTVSQSRQYPAECSSCPSMARCCQIARLTQNR